MGDQIVFQESLMQDSGVTNPFIEKQWVEVYDSNSSVYTGNQIILSTSALTNGGRWIDMSNAYLRIPLVMTFYNTETNAALATYSNANFGMALKNGFHHLIHSIDIKLNGTSLTNVCSYQNILYHFKSIQSMAVNDLQSQPSINFYPDTSQSWSYQANTSPDGRGICNNRPFGAGRLSIYNRLLNITGAQIDANTIPSSNVAAGGYVTDVGTQPYPTLIGTIATEGNEGMLKRQYQYAFDPVNARYSDIFTKASTEGVWQNYFDGSNANGKVWYIMAIIPLKQISSLMENMPLVRGVKFDFLINVNQGSANVLTATVAAADGLPAHLKLTQTSATSSYGVLPMMVASADAGQPNQTCATGAVTITAGLGIVNYSTTSAQGTFPATLSHPCKNTALVVPTYMMDTTSENEYLSVNPTKTIFYKDATNYILTNQSGNVQQLILTSAVRPMSLVIAPFNNSAANGGLGYSPLLSVFDSAPATTSPAQFYDYQVQVSGTNVYQTAINYSYQNFVQELNSYNTLNGNVVPALGSGLISQIDWENNYHFLVTDLSRRVRDSTPKSIMVQMQIKSKLALDLYCYVETLRSIKLDLKTGDLLEVNSA